MNFVVSWHHLIMNKTDVSRPDPAPAELLWAQRWAKMRCEQPLCIVYEPQVHGDPIRLRCALRQTGVPALELNDASANVLTDWVDAAMALADEFLIPVVLFGAGDAHLPAATLAHGDGCLVDDGDWLVARSVALQAAIEASVLHRETRRSGAKVGWIRLGWHDDAALAEGNGLLLAWSSPLPLMRLRNFSARCAERIDIQGPGAGDLADDVASQGISVTHWQIAVK
jgi:hypothetical protein